MSTLGGWDIHDRALIKTFEFSGFDEAIEFVNQLAAVARELDHHPDWQNSYNKVSLKLSTHSAGGVTRKDVELARRADKIASRI